MTVDLTQLPQPLVIEELDYETVYQSLLAQFKSILGTDWTASLESDPVVKLLELSAYREMLVRSRINDAARSVMLAFAVGSDLDQIAARFGVERLLVAAGDATALPPASDIFESDDRLRLRTQLSLEGFTTAGPRGMYLFHALSASARVLEASVAGPELIWDGGIPSSTNGIPPGTVMVYLLSTDNGNVPDSDLIQTVQAYLSDETRRPLCDTVTVAAAEIVTYSVSATLYIYPGPLAADVQARASAAVAAATENLFKIGYDIQPSALIAALSVSGVQHVSLSQPAAPVIIGAGQVAKCTAITISIGGVET